MADDPQRTLSNEDRRTGGGIVATTPHLFRILVGERPLAGGARHSLAAVQTVTIGRKASLTTERRGTELVLGIPDARMSTRHARLVRTVDGWSVTDEGSTNGTRVDGAPTTRAPLTDGAILEVGSTCFSFHSALLSDPAGPFDVEADALADRVLGLATLLPSHASSIAALRRLAAANVPVLLLGPSGAGKEVLARAVHTMSGRKGAFVAINCGALPETLLESQLFGHLKGAFSGAQREELGLVRASDGGTLFLDEIGDMRASSQVALLRVLQEREVTPVGSTKPIAVDLRVVAATHRPVDQLEAGGFRNDLYARLAGFTHRLPPLRERMEDLGIIVADVLRRVAPERSDTLTITSSVTRALIEHTWPLNVRELEQALSVAVLLATDGRIDLSHAPESLRTPSPPSTPSAPTATSPQPALGPEDEVLRSTLIAALRQHGGNVTHVAREMGKTRMQIHRWMRRFSVDPDGYRR